ncbi:MAG: hypothetical protein BMS9Abin19_0922 [Gammaproteobacteria bacterium]|nr:MAG: hypothetical protein BMS9Abin19_0922 [Gammaproteobacteria bacterium]
MRKYLHPGTKKALIVFFTILLSMAIVVALSDTYKWDADEENTRAKRDMRKWRNKIEEANRNNQILVEHENTFLRLKEKSVIGDENRLSWVEVIQKTAQSRGMASVKYNISSQILQDKKALGKKYKGIDIFKSTMSLDMKFIHEGDLFAMLNALRNHAQGLSIIDRCDIELVNKSDPVDLSSEMARENMNAYCELSWYTLKKAGKV